MRKILNVFRDIYVIAHCTLPVLESDTVTVTALSYFFVSMSHDNAIA